ncbi:hypothetical protein KEJ32_06930, partial [Candidatus Bathyarchaeota archaeon]|nr:hypothetical protein [Candidatus Bathyarchaeota archaeon]
AFVMKFGRGFVKGFLVLGFAIFILGFLTGMLAIALTNIKMDSSILFIVFSAGLITGILIVALAIVSVKAKSLELSS